MKKTLAIMLAAAMMVSAFVGCQAAPTESKTPDATKAPDAASQSTEDPAEDVHIIWATWSNGIQKDTVEVMESLNKELDTILPGYSFEFLEWAGAEYIDKLDRALAGGEQMDVAWKSSGMQTTTYYDNGSMSDLTDYISDELKASIPEFIFNGGKVDDAMCFMPKYEMHHWVEGMYTDATKYDKYWDESLYQAYLEDYKTQTIRTIPDSMYTMYEDYLQAAKDGGEIGSGFSPFMFNQNGGVELIVGGMPFLIEEPAHIGQEWDSEVKFQYARPVTEQRYAKLAEWKANGLMRSDYIELDNKRVYENTNEDGNLIWFHNYVNADDPTHESIQRKSRNDWENEYIVIPMTTPIVKNPGNDGLFVPYTAKDVQNSMNMIELCYTEKGVEWKNHLLFGIEDTHYAQPSEGRVERLTDAGAGIAATNTYGRPAWPFGNCHTTWLEPTQADNTYEYYASIMSPEMAIQSPYAALTIKTADWEAELTEIKSLNAKYADSFNCGNYTPELYAEMLTAFDNLGVDEMVADFQAQVDAYLAK